MKYRMMIAPLCCLFLVLMNAHGQYKSMPKNQTDSPTLTGNLQYDLSMNTDQAGGLDTSDVTRPVTYKRKYSPMRAALFSAVIPGAGQLYTKSYLQSAAFFGAEVLMWVLYAVNEKKGDDKTDEYQKYADENWSTIRYASWMINWFNGVVFDTNIVQWQSWQSSDLKRPWDYVNMQLLRSAEDSIRNWPFETGFSHNLESHGNQQYYEMIGKYPQFGGGWNDATGYKSNDVITGNVSPNFSRYSQMRGDANSAYNIATTVSFIIVANHIFSALEAAWNASRINHRIRLQGHIQSRTIYGNLVEFVPTLHVEYEL